MNRSEFSKLISGRAHVKVGGGGGGGGGHSDRPKTKLVDRCVYTGNVCVQGRVATALYPALSRAALADDVLGFYPF